MKKLSLILMLGLLSVLTACSKTENVTKVEEGTTNVVESMEVVTKPTDSEGKFYAEQHYLTIDENWDKYIYLNDVETSEDNFYEVISNVNHELKSDSYVIHRADGVTAGYVIGNMEKVSFNYSSVVGTTDESKVACGDSYEKVVKVLGTPTYDGLADKLFVSYDKESKQLTIQFEELNGNTKVSGITISNLNK